jgi:2-haloacid dehalogenase
MLTAPKLVTFDVYMALLDIQGSLCLQVGDVFGLDGGDASAFVTHWRAKQMERAASSNALGLGHTPFRDCTAMALEHSCARFAVEASTDIRESLVNAWGELNPWPEADDALAAVKARGCSIAILSNGDTATLISVARQFRTPFDYVLSAESAGNYKPHPSVYALPARILGVPVADTVHVAGSGNDVLGSIAFGMRCIWSNRTGEAPIDPRYPPTHEVRGLNEVAERL